MEETVSVPEQRHGYPRAGSAAFVDEAMADWIALLRTGEPWNRMLLDDVTGEFRSVLQALLCMPDDCTPGVRAARLRRGARAHGAFRRRQGCRGPVLKEELTAAEDAIAIALQRSGAEAALIATFQASLRPVISAVERAAYGGYVDMDEW